MKYIFIFLLLVQLPAFAQEVVTVPLSSENRTEENAVNQSNARIALDLQTKLKLPFFDDFSSVQVPVDSIYNKSNEPVKIISRGLHGLNDGDEIHYFNSITDPDSTKLSGASFINGTWYTKVIDPFSFSLFKDNLLTDTLKGNDKVFFYSTWDPSTKKRIISNFYGYWLREGAIMQGTPDELKWQKVNSQPQGAWVNTRFGINPPSYGVATLDGLNAQGAPYNTKNEFINGPTDVLTSRAIDLSSVNKKDSLFFSFFWQAGGLGDYPEKNDTLSIDFLNKDSVWVRADSIIGVGDLTNFKFKSIPLRDSARYFHNKFQFRFRAFGRQAGAFDVWNIDYVYLNTGRHTNDSLLGDVSIIQPQTPLLKNYSAMPMNHFKASDIASAISFKSRNNRNDIAQHQYDVTILNKFIFQALPIFNPNQIVAVNFPTPTINWDSIPKNGRAELKSKFFLNKADNTIPGIDLTVNNYDSLSTVLDNYYAYDDGSAEAAIGIEGVGSSLTRMASKFMLDSADILKSVAIYFPQKSPAIANQTVRILVIKSFKANQVGDEDIHTQNHVITSADINNFVTITLSKDIPLNKGNFYIGIQKLTDASVMIGLDKNTVRDTTFYIKINRTWRVSAEGSFMIRPIFGDGILIPVKDAVSEALNADIFPNPSSGDFNIRGEVKNVKVFDISGKLVFEKELDLHSDINTIDLNQLSEGFYLAHLSNENFSAVKKLIISR